MAKRWLIALLTGLAIFSCAYAFQHAILFDNMNGYWKHGQTVNSDGVTIDTYIPQSEFVDKWEERIELTHVKVKSSMTAGKYYQQVVQGNLNNMCYYSVPKVQFLRRKANDIIYEYHVISCGKKAMLVVVGRIMGSNGAVNTMTYTIKTAKVN